MTCVSEDTIENNVTRPAKTQACTGNRVLTRSLGDPIMAISLSNR